MLAGVCSVGRAKAGKRWRELEGRLQVHSVAMLL